MSRHGGGGPERLEVLAALDGVAGPDEPVPVGGYSFGAVADVTAGRPAVTHATVEGTGHFFAGAGERLVETAARLVTTL